MGSQDKLKVNLQWVYFPVLHTLPSTFLEHANYIRCRLKKKRHKAPAVLAVRPMTLGH